MATIENWVEKTARRIADEVSATVAADVGVCNVDPMQVAQIIVETCPFEPDTAYVKADAALAEAVRTIEQSAWSRSRRMCRDAWQRFTSLTGLQRPTAFDRPTEIRPRVTSTHAYAVLEVSAVAFREIQRALLEAGYQHAFHDDKIDMHGIAIQQGEPRIDCRCDTSACEVHG